MNKHMCVTPEGLWISTPYIIITTKTTTTATTTTTTTTFLGCDSIELNLVYIALSRFYIENVRKIWMYEKIKDCVF